MYVRVATTQKHASSHRNAGVFQPPMTFTTAAISTPLTQAVSRRSCAGSSATCRCRIARSFTRGRSSGSSPVRARQLAGSGSSQCA